MKVAFSRRFAELELTGSVAELGDVATQLEAGHGALILDTSGDPAPYDAFVGRLEVGVENGSDVMLLVDEASSTLYVRGGQEKLNLLATNVRNLATAPDPNLHLHVDYFPGHHYLAPGSAPLVVARN